MTVFNRRNAMIGWIAWSAGKRAASYAAKDAARGAKPAIHPKTKKPNKAAIMVGVMTAVGAFAIWKSKKKSSGDADVPQPDVSDTKVSDTAGV
jgi:hypothetical protein